MFLAGMKDVKVGSKGPFLGLECHECESPQSPFQCLPGLFPRAEQRHDEEAFFLVSGGP